MRFKKQLRSCVHLAPDWAKPCVVSISGVAYWRILIILSRREDEITARLNLFHGLLTNMCFVINIKSICKLQPRHMYIIDIYIIHCEVLIINKHLLIINKHNLLRSDLSLLIYIRYSKIQMFNTILGTREALPCGRLDYFTLTKSLNRSLKQTGRFLFNFHAISP